MNYSVFLRTGTNELERVAGAGREASCFGKAGAWQRAASRHGGAAWKEPQKGYWMRE